MEVRAHALVGAAFVELRAPWGHARDVLDAVASSARAASGADPATSASAWDLRTELRAAVAGAIELASGTLGWFAVAALAYRVAISLLLVVAALGAFGPGTPRAVLAAIGAVLAGNVVLLAGASTGRYRRLLRSRELLAVDLLVTAGLNLWATALLPHGTLVLSGRDVVWGYTFGLVSFWTGMRGPKLGAVLVANAMGLELAMVAINGAVMDVAGLRHYLARLAWLISAYSLALLIMVLARHGALMAWAEGLRAGREAERAQALRALHDTVLQTLARLAQLAVATDRAAERRLDEIREIALDEANRLRVAFRLQDTRAGASGGLAAGLEALAQRFGLLGLRVELETSGLGGLGDRGARPGHTLDATLPPEAVEALVQAAAEALTNVHKHSGVSLATLRAARLRAGVEVVIQDRGRGFDPSRTALGLGLAHSVVDRMEEAGGSAAVWARQGEGTRIRLAVPTRPPAVPWALSYLPGGGRLAAPAETPSKGPGPAGSSGVLVGRALGWCLMAALAWFLVVDVALAAGLGGAIPGVAGWLADDARISWLIASFVLGWMVICLARRWVSLAAEAGLRAGREVERAQALRDLHDTVLATLTGLAQRAELAQQPAEERLREIRAIALGQAGRLRAALRRQDQDARSHVPTPGGAVIGLTSELRALVQEFRELGVRVELVNAGLDADAGPPLAVVQALVAATRDALRRVCEQAGLASAVVRVAAAPAAAEVVVRDRGSGPALGEQAGGPELAAALACRMREVGGSAELWSRSGHGTRVRLRWEG
jgi:signal transduction histidine kinase